MTARKEAFIRFMMGADVLRFGEFKTKSGRLTPYFINTGNYRTGAQLAALGRFYAELVRDTCGSDFDALFGPAYKGIPLVAATAASLATDFGVDKPYFFNRKEVKDHGEGGGLVGYPPKDGDRILIIDAYPSGMRQSNGAGHVHFGQPVRGGAESRQNRRHGGAGGIRHPGTLSGDGTGYLRILEGSGGIPRHTAAHGSLYAAVLCV